MMICETCEEVFDEPETIYEPHPYGDGCANEEFWVCPHCGSTSITEAKQCEQCDEWFAELEDGLCEDCYGDEYGE